MIHLPLLINKLRSIFDPERNMPFNERLPDGSEQFQGPPSQVPINPTGTSYGDGLDRTMENRFNSMLDQFPQRPEHTSKMRQLGAVIAGMGSDNPLATADQVKNYHYYNALKDYNAKLPYFQQAADNERMINRDVINQQIQDRRLTEQERYNRERDANADQTNSRLVQKDQDTKDLNAKKLDLAERTYQLRDWIARNRGYNLVTDGTTGEVLAVDKLDPNKRTRTGIQSKDLTDLQKIDLGLDAASLIEKRGTEERKNIGARGAETRNTVQFRETIPYNPTAHRPTSSSGGKTTNADLTAKAKTIRSQRPDLAPYIKMGPSGNTFIEIAKPEEKGGIYGLADSFFGRSQKPVDHDSKIKEANRLMFGESTSSTGKWVKDANGVMIRK